MNNIYNGEVKTKSNIAIILISIFISAIIAGGGVFIYYQREMANMKNEVDKKIEDLNGSINKLKDSEKDLKIENGDLNKAKESLETENGDLNKAKESLETENDDLNRGIEKLSCKGIWDEEQGCMKAPLKILYPNGGESFCLKKTNIIKWIAPKDLDSVRIYITTLSSSNDLGVFKAVTKTENGVDIGELEWDGNNVNGYKVKPSDVYKIRIESYYNGEAIRDYSDNVFSVVDECK